MSLRQKQLPTFRSVTAGQPAAAKLTLGQKYHAIWLELGDNVGTTLASGNLIGEIRVIIDGTPQRRIKGTELAAINGLNGEDFGIKTSGVAGTAAYRTYLPIWFAEPWRKSNGEAQKVAWNAVGIPSFELEVDIGNGLVAPVCQGWYEYEPADGPLGIITKWQRKSINLASNVYELDDLNRKDYLQAIHLFPTSDNHYTNLVRLTAGGIVYRDNITHKQNQATLIGREMNPDTSAVPRYDIVMDYDDPINGALDLRPGGKSLNELNLHLEYDAAVNGSQVIVIEKAGLPDTEVNGQIQ